MDNETCGVCGNARLFGHICMGDKRSREDKVREFHAKFGFSMDRKLSTYNDVDVDRELLVLGTRLRDWAREFQKKAEVEQRNGDERLYRAHLLVEELGECLQSMGMRHEVSFADALGDLQYVLSGTALTYAIPLKEVFDEIHRSNMTKIRTEGDQRMRTKDPALGYSKPDIQKAIDLGRASYDVR
jgi:predicted HAD superfamily Cof-like phosphohydrolase